MAHTEPHPGHILLVEDDPCLATMLSDVLRARGYSVWHVQSGSDAEAKVNELRPDLILLDLMLPDSNGLVLCSNLKARAAAPVIICSATKRKDDAVIGLRLGADDFLPKPFSLDELLARIDVALRRGAVLERRGAVLERGEAAQSDQVQELGSLRIDKTRRRASVAGRVLQLTPTEYRLLDALADRATEVLSREELAEGIWGCVDNGVLRSLDVHIRRLRAKLTAAGNGGPRVVTRRGFGYQLVDERSGSLVDQYQVGSAVPAQSVEPG